MNRVEFSSLIKRKTKSYKYLIIIYVYVTHMYLKEPIYILARHMYSARETKFYVFFLGVPKLIL